MIEWTVNASSLRLRLVTVPGGSSIPKGSGFRVLEQLEVTFRCRHGSRLGVPKGGQPPLNGLGARRLRSSMLQIVAHGRDGFRHVRAPVPNAEAVRWRPAEVGAVDAARQQ